MKSDIIMVSSGQIKQYNLLHAPIGFDTVQIHLNLVQTRLTFEIVNVLILNGNVPGSFSYSVYISQFIFLMRERSKATSTREIKG